MEIQINKMILSDLETIKDTLISDFDDFWTYETLKEELNSEFSHFYIAKNENNEILGFAGLKIVIDEADIMNIVVKKDLRNNGIGTLLLEYLINFAKSKSIKSITLEVNENNSSAIALYQKFDFKQISIRKKYYNNIDNAIIMQKRD